MRIDLIDKKSAKRQLNSNKDLLSNVLMVLRWGVILVLLSFLLTYDIFDYIKSQGVQGPAFRSSPYNYVKSIVSETPKSFFSGNNLEELRLDIKFKDWEKLSGYRNTGVKNNIISRNEKDYVNANILFNNNKYTSKIRLKGDWSDHLYGDKWSFRVKLQNNGYIKGIKKFSLQSPATRDFQGQPIIDKMLKEYNILTPRHFYVNLVINGKNIGVMSLYEHFSKELIESNNRKESVIIKFDEEDLWQSRVNKKTYEVDQYSAIITAFEEKKLKKNKNLQQNFNLAVGLMRGFLKGNLRADEVFDVKLMGDFLAINDLWGESHGLIWHNMRFYYNPISAKLEPIGHDQMLYHNVTTLDYSNDWISNDKFIAKIRGNGYIHLSYINTLRELRSKMKNQTHLRQYIDLDNKYESLLRSEFIFKPPPLMKGNNLVKRLDLILARAVKSVVHMEKTGNDVSWAVDPSSTSRVVSIKSADVINKANVFFGDFYRYGLKNLGIDNAFHGYKNDQDSSDAKYADLDKTSFPIERVDFGKFQKVANVFHYDVDKDHYLEVQSIIPHALEVKNIQIIFNKDEKLVRMTTNLDVIGGILHPYKTKIIKLEGASEGKVEQVLLEMSSPGADNNILFFAKDYRGALDKSPIPESTVKEQLKTHKFLIFNQEKKIMSIKSGEWEVDEPLIIPSGYTLKASKGTVLKFSKNSYLLSRGRIDFSGSYDAPVIFKSQSNSEYWKGIVILGNSLLPESRMENVTIMNTTSLDNNGWQIDAGTFIYQSSTFLDNVKIINNNCEDALNIVNSKYVINNILIKNALFDGLDSDFSIGEVTESVFVNIGQSGGGDAIDFSGSIASLSEVSIHNVEDKGVSIGEKSDVQVDSAELSDTSIAIAVKDGSHLEIKNSKIIDSIKGISAYIKKREYNGATVGLHNIEFKNVNQHLDFDKKSVISLDNKIVNH